MHSAVVRADGSLWVWGHNEVGQLGDGTRINRLTPVRLGSDNQWQQVSCGERHTVALRKDGSLWAWGSNGSGQLADSMARPFLTPKRIGTATSWQQVSAADDYTVAIRQDGSLWVWGAEPLSASNAMPLLVPTRIGTSNSWQSISASNSHVVGIQKDGTLWAWGSNFQGALGDGTQIGRQKPKRIGKASDWVFACAGWLSTVAIRRDGSLWGWGFINNPKRLNVPQRIGTANGWKSAAVTDGNDARLVAIRQNGSLWQYIRPNLQPPQPVLVPVKKDTNWQWVTAGNTHVLAARTDGTLWSWGKNEFGQVGVPALRASYQPLPVPLQPATT